MPRRFILSLSGVIVAVALMPGAVAASGTSVSVRVEGKSQTLMLAKPVQTHSGWITRFGAPKGDCPAKSAAGSLDLATRHRWSGKWATGAGFADYEVMSILGEKHPFSSHYYWGLWVNSVYSSTGVCETKLHQGDHLLFVAVPDSGTVYPLAVHAPSTATVGHAFKVKVLWFNGKGKSAPLAGATIGAHKTNRNGIVLITPTKKGTLTLTAEKRGYIRAEAQVKVS